MTLAVYHAMHRGVDHHSLHRLNPTLPRKVAERIAAADGQWANLMFTTLLTDGGVGQPRASAGIEHEEVDRLAIGSEITG